MPLTVLSVAHPLVPVSLEAASGAGQTILDPARRARLGHAGAPAHTHANAAGIPEPDLNEFRKSAQKPYPAARLADPCPDVSPNDGMATRRPEYRSFLRTSGELNG